MAKTPIKNGIAIACNREGIVESVVRDELGLAAQLEVGQSVLRLVDPVDEEKGRQFLLTLQNRQAVFDWEIVVRWKDQLVPLHFAGAAKDQGFLVIVALSLPGLTELNDDLMEINHEQLNILRTTVKELAGQHRQRSGEVYDELTRINNELANLQRELFQKNVQLAKLNELKNQFLGIAAHDLRSPLGIILTYSDFLEREVAAKLSPEQQEFISIIKTTSQFLRRLIDDLLDVSRIESGHLNLDLEPTELSQLVLHNVRLNRVLAEQKQVRIALIIDQQPPILWLDPGKIEQVLNNLLDNAMKFSPPESEVTVRLGSDERFAEITVIDQGAGISEPELKHLFEPFSRLKVKSGGGEAGTGLGLLIVHRIVEGHRGSVTVDSTLGMGSAFRVRLPLGPPSETFPDRSQAAGVPMSTPLSR